MRRVYLVLSSMLLFSGVSLFAFDFSVEALFGNAGFPWKPETAVTGDNFPATFWNYGAKASLTQSLAENFRVETVYETDPLLRNIVRSIFSYESGIIRISVGPVLGVFNSATAPLKGGISAGIRLDAPGIAYASMSTDASIGANLLTAGDYMQESGEIAAGFYVYNAICTGSLSTKRFYKTISPGNILADASTLYEFSVDVFRKGSPYRVLVGMGYKTLSRTYPDATVDKLSMVVARTRINADMSKAIGLVAEFGASLYNIGFEELAGRSPLSTSLLFQSGLGVTIKVDMLGKSVPKKEKNAVEPALPMDSAKPAEGDSSSAVTETPKTE